MTPAADTPPRTPPRGRGPGGTESSGALAETETVVSTSLLARWVEDWARLEALALELGGPTAAAAATQQPHNKRKKELLSTRLMKLQVSSLLVSFRAF